MDATIHNSTAVLWAGFRVSLLPGVCPASRSFSPNFICIMSPIRSPLKRFRRTPGQGSIAPPSIKKPLRPIGRHSGFKALKTLQRKGKLDRRSIGLANADPLHFGHRAVGGGADVDKGDADKSHPCFAQTYKKQIVWVSSCKPFPMICRFVGAGQSIIRRHKNQKGKKANHGDGCRF